MKKLLSTNVALVVVDDKERLELFINLVKSDHCIEFDTDEYHYVFESPDIDLELLTMISGVLDLSNLTLISKEVLHARNSPIATSSRI